MMAAGQGKLDLGLRAGGSVGGPPPITSSWMGHPLDALEHVYRVLGSWTRPAEMKCFFSF